MQLTKLLAATAVLGLAGVCLAGEKWDTKDPSAWSHDDIDKLMRDSPWARQGKVTLGGNPGGMNRGGGQYPNDPNDPNDPNAGNYPGGGYPGGSSRRGGIYLPGGIGFPGGGGGMGYPGGRGGGRGGNRRQSPVTSTAIVRWDSALPLRLAYAQQDPNGHAAPAESAAQAGASQPGGWRKAGDASAPSASAAPPSPAASPAQTPAEYIIAVDGFSLNTGSGRYSRQRSGSGSPQSGDTGANDDTRDRSQYGGRDPDAIREELMERTTLTRGNGRVLRPVKVEFDLPGKLGIIYFHFSREEEITLKDKELNFQTQLGNNRLERKFETKEMVYKGKLEL